MKKIVIAVGGVLFSLSLLAGEGEEWEFLSASPGVRSMGLGGAGTALGDDHASGVLNPAGLGRLARGEVSLSHHEGVESIIRDSLGVAFPMEKGTLAARWSGVDYGTISGLDSSGNALGNIGAREDWFQISGAGGFRNRVWAGIALNQTERKFHDQSIQGAFFDGGLLARLPAPTFFQGFRAGVSVRRLGVGWSPGQGPPRELRFGIATGVWDEKITLAADLVQSNGEDLRPMVGIEYASGGSSFFRLGYDGSTEDSFTYGLGFRVGDLRLDYAFAPLGDLGNTHHVGLVWHFGKPAEAFYEKGLGYLRQEDFARAVVNFNRALAADPHHSKALLKLREANQRLKKEWDDSGR
ncbi:MAG: hypothetical protein JNK54_06885 [Elusimicrobia bacterium]|nr:hypothetical protein [Elusimicrobiota bacterium]